MLFFHYRGEEGQGEEIGVVSKNKSAGKLLLKVKSPRDTIIYIFETWERIT